MDDDRKIFYYVVATMTGRGFLAWDVANNVCVKEVEQDVMDEIKGYQPTVGDFVVGLLAAQSSGLVFVPEELFNEKQTLQ